MKHKFYWLNPKVAPKSTGRYGDGLFATDDISKGERVLIVGGYILTVDEESKLPGKSHDNGVQITEDLVICTTNEEEYDGFNYLNHNCTPNCGFKGQIFLVTMRDIKKGEEITIDYAMVLHRSSNGPRYELECLCGDALCRKTVTDEDWKDKKLQEKYNGYFQFYLQEKVDSLNKGND